MRSSRPSDAGYSADTTALSSLADSSMWSIVRIGVRTTPVLVAGIGLTILLALTAGAGRLVPPVVIQAVIDRSLLTEQSDGSTVVAAVLIGVVALTVAGIASWRLGIRVYERTETAFSQLRQRGLQQSHEVSPAVSANAPSAEFVSRLTADIDQMTVFVQSGGVLLLINISQMMIATVIMAYYSWPLASMVVLLAVAFIVAMRTMQRVIARRFSTVRSSVSALQSVVAETASGIGVIYTTGTQDRQLNRLTSAIDQLERDQRKSLPPLHANTALGEITISLMTVLVIVGGTWWATGPAERVGLPQLTAGELIAFVFLVTFFVRPLQHLVQSLGEAQNALTGWRRVLELVHTPSHVVPDELGRQLPEGPISVQLSDVGAAYPGGPRVIGDVSLDIPAGQHIAIVGATGSGKSTIAKLLTRQLSAATGSIRLSGVDIDTIADSALERRVAIVPQDPFLFDDTIASNIAVGVPGVSQDAIDSVVDLLGLGDWIADQAHGIDTMVGTRGESLSVGERQLVALARTALVDPDLLVLDEATSGVDPATDVRVQLALASLTLGRTTVTIAHRLATAERADRVLVMSGGQVVQDGSPAALRAVAGPYAQLHASWSDVAPRANDLSSQRRPTDQRKDT